ncbi:MAG: hypothetical protein MJ192_05190 [Clostridia bacterium]|nr:hypothetical protein [Clostridia bacterium]
MPENRFPCGPDRAGNGGGKEGPRETVCIETNRILDSCRDRDCYENVRVFLTDAGQELIDNGGLCSSQVRVKDAGIAWTYIGIDPVQFNRGFYAITIRYYVKLIMEACTAGGRSQEFDGIALLEKQAVLFGGESSVSVFRSSGECGGFCGGPEPCFKERSVPTAVVEVVEPIVLGSKIADVRAECPGGCHVRACDIPESICGCLSGPLAPEPAEETGCCCACRRVLTVSLGIFSMVRVVRPAQYLVTASEFIIPDKECVSGTPSDPCALFRSMAFPVGEFSPTGFPCGTVLQPEKPSHCGCGN